MCDVICVAVVVVVSVGVGIFLGFALREEPAVARSLTSKEDSYLYTLIIAYDALINSTLKLMAQVWRVPLSVAGWLRRHRRLQMRRQLIVKCIHARLDEAPVVGLPRSSHNSRRGPSSKHRSYPRWQKLKRRSKQQRLNSPKVRNRSAEAPYVRQTRSSSPRCSIAAEVIGLILLAVNPCTALLFPTEYCIMPLVLCVAPLVWLVLLFMLIEWLLLLSFVTNGGTQLYHALVACQVRRSLRYCSQQPRRATCGIAHVLARTACGVFSVAQYQVQCLFSDICLCVPDASCWLWLVEFMKRAMRRFFGAVSERSPERRTACAADAEMGQRARTYARKRTLDERRAEEWHRWRELQNPCVRKRHERSQRRQRARATRASVFLRRALYHAYCQRNATVSNYSRSRGGGGSPVVDCCIEINSCDERDHDAGGSATLPGLDIFDDSCVQEHLARHLPDENPSVSGRTKSGVQCIGAMTCGDGCCALHSIWGIPTWSPHGGYWLYCTNARGRLLASLPEDVDGVLAGQNVGAFCQVVECMWRDLVRYADQKRSGAVDTIRDACGSKVLWDVCEPGMQRRLLDHAAEMHAEDNDQRNLEETHPKSTI